MCIRDRVTVGHDLRSQSTVTVCAHDLRSRSTLTICAHGLRSQSALTIYGHGQRSRSGLMHSLRSRFALTVTVCAHHCTICARDLRSRSALTRLTIGTHIHRASAASPGSASLRFRLIRSSKVRWGYSDRRVIVTNFTLNDCPPQNV